MDWFFFGLGVGVVHSLILFLLLSLARASAKAEGEQTLELMRERNELDRLKAAKLDSIADAICDCVDKHDVPQDARQEAGHGRPHGGSINSVKSEWINCSERLPDEDIDVLVFNGVDVSIGHMEDDQWYYAEGLPTDHITHWAEIPEGPQ